MSARNYTAIMRTRQITASSDTLRKFSEMYVFDAELRSRMSELFWFDLYILDMEFGISPVEVLQSVQDVEQGETNQRGVKPATLFKNPPLKGLWHKHYFAARFLVHNMINGLGKNGLKQLIEEVMDPAKSSVVTKEMIEELAHRVTHEPLEQRDASGKLTGEWIIFLKHSGKNYYLCTNTHAAGDQFIYDRIAEHCGRDFPHIKAWISEAASACP